MPRRRWSACLLLVAVLVAGCEQPVPPGRTVRIATGSPTAVYYAIGNAYARILSAELPGTSAEALVTAASAANVALVRDGGAEVGFTQADILNGLPQSSSISAMARVYDDHLHLVVAARGRIQRLADLRGRAVSVGAPGSGTEVTTGRLLATAGLTGALTESRLGLDDSAAELAAGHIDAFFFSGGLPVAAVNQLSRRTPIRLIDLGEWVGPLRKRYGDVYVARDVPRSVYGLPVITTVAVPNYLIVRNDLPRGLVYDLTRLLIEKRDQLGRAHPAAEQLNARSAITTAPLPLHPGAIAYYRDAKH
ncbi:TAXI family TRAP transporter solute-binding subunit [Micromonospora zhanjiangensis]|uniref:TAXI family TRAP transporter solute-binding subunit n=1 Tax=Micromonospora zhanjiangensis TaxID=1522057 RepID=A0ABV8KSC2_9ACTN